MSQGCSGDAASSGPVRRSFCPLCKNPLGAGRLGVEPRGTAAFGSCIPQNYPSACRESGAKPICGPAGGEGRLQLFPSPAMPVAAQASSEDEAEKCFRNSPGSYNPTQTPKGVKEKWLPHSRAVIWAEKSENWDRATQNSYTLP